jgi:RND family efflux transporter MFP subunit
MNNKLNYMKNITWKITFAVIITAALTACGSGAKDKKGDLGDLKVKLEKLKKDKNGLDEQIRQVEAQIAKADPASAQALKLVSVATLSAQDFSHYIELQGKIDADQMAYVSPPGQPGVVKAIYIQNGSRVSKGQVLLKLDDALARQSVVAAQQQVSQIKARLAQAQTVYQRRQNLWKENIGTEIEVINAKADVDALASQVRGAEAQVSAAQEQLAQTNVTAQISGVVERINVKLGELFTGAVGNTPQIVLVNNSNLKITANVPENYISRVKKGDSVQVVINETGKPYRSILYNVGAAIDATNRSFIAEGKLPSDPLLKPNQLATMKILDYKAKAAVTVPLNTVQTDEKGKYVYVIEKNGDKMIARKKSVTVGESYNGITEIKNGLAGTETIITEGYQTVYDGQSVTTATR